MRLRLPPRTERVSLDPADSQAVPEHHSTSGYTPMQSSEWAGSRTPWEIVGLPLHKGAL